MKTGKFALAAFALLLGLAACDKIRPKNPDNPDNPDNPVNNDPGQTEEEEESTPIVFTATVDGGWEGITTSVGVMIDSTVKKYSVGDADNTSATLSSDDPHYWSTNHDDITVMAWWPYTEGETTPPNVVVKADQSTQENFAASDFISAENQTVTYDNPTLTFSHRTARVTVNLVPGNGVTSVNGATVTLTSLSTENGNPDEIKACNTSDDTHEALTAPQTVKAGNPFIQVKLDDTTFPYSQQDDVVLDAGYRYTFTIKVNVTGLTLEGSTINDWVDDGGESGAAIPDYIYNTETNTYTVYTAVGLLAWNEAVQSDLSLNCILADDIDMTGINWTPVGNISNQYTGAFYGGGRTITGLTVNRNSSSCVGLISYLGSEGRVQVLTLENMNITGYNYVGGVVGYNNGTVLSCSVSGSVTGSTSNIGGVVGYNNSGTVTACNSSSSVTGSDAAIGGVVGYNNSGTVTACTSSGYVSSSGIHIGGVVGINYYGTVIACYHASGIISGTGSYVGGVVGNNNSGNVIACFHASGNLSGSSYVGSVAGCNYNNGTVTGCYWSDYDGDSIGENYGGTVQTTKVDGTDVTWEYDAVDGMNEAIETWNTNNPDKQCEWKYEFTEETYPLPGLTK